jgi:hypothetical protein
MKIFLIFLLSIHGLIHAMGFVKAFHLAELPGLSLPVSKTAGTFWLLASVLFVVTLCLLLIHEEAWWIPASAGIILSQVLIFSAWQDAKYGTAANLIILVPVVISMLNMLPSSYRSRYRTEVQDRLSASYDTSVIREADIDHLPAPVKKYLRYVGAVGKPKVYNFRAVFTGTMRQKPDGGWMKIRSQQYNFFDDPARLFYIESDMFGIPFNGFHHYTGNHAVMQIKIANLFTIVDARGDKMDQGETVTMFNDMCLMAPATLIDTNIAWEGINDTMAEAVFTNGNNTIAATLHFNDDGALTNFISYDRFLSYDGKEYLAYPWSTPVKSYRVCNGRKIPSCGEAIWQTPEGPFSYGRFDIKEITYNLATP